MPLPPITQLERDNQAHYADKGGFVSPGGLSYIGNSEEKLGEAACAAVKRINMDEKVARCAQKAGANLFENAEVRNGGALAAAPCPLDSL